jgi:hypothetical protein
MKEYRQFPLHDHLQTRRTSPLQIMPINCPHADEINACNDDLVVAINEVIAGNKTLTKKPSDFTDKFI